VLISVIKTYHSTLVTDGCTMYNTGVALEFLLNEMLFVVCNCMHCVNCCNY